MLLFITKNIAFILNFIKSNHDLKDKLVVLLKIKLITLVANLGAFTGIISSSFDKMKSLALKSKVETIL